MKAPDFETTWFDRITSQIAPRWTERRLRARVAIDLLARNYEAASRGRRTNGWTRHRGDANAVAASALPELRMHARDLIRNNAWARRGQRVIANNTVGWGIVPKALGKGAATADKVWKAWAESTDCDSEGVRNFYGIQKQVMRTVVADGECLIRARLRKESDGYPIPLQLQVLEADHLDTSKDGIKSAAGGRTIQGVEFDQLGERIAYWLFPEHPGGSQATSPSKRVPAKDILHVFDPERAGQVRGVSWFGAAIVPLKDLDEYEDAELVKQKIAACFAAFVTDPQGAGGGEMGAADEDDEDVSVLQPGMIHHLPPGKEVTFGSPPALPNDAFTARVLRKVAAGLGVTYEDLTGDYSKVNFSSARMGRLAHWASVDDWRWNMLVPQMCVGVWRWAMLAAQLDVATAAQWIAPPPPMLEPDKEGLAYSRLIRNGLKTHDDAIRELGGDPDTHWPAFAKGNAARDRLGIVLDSDPRQTSASGQLHPEDAPAEPAEPVE